MAHKDGEAVAVRVYKVAALDKMAKILGLYAEKQAPDTQVPITKVTIILSGVGKQDADTRPVIDSTSRVLDPSEEELPT